MALKPKDGSFNNSNEFQMASFSSHSIDTERGFSCFILNIARGLFLGSLLATPWMIGGVPYWATFIAVGLFFVLSLLVGFASLFNKVVYPVSKISILLGILLAYPALQLVPLSFQENPLDRIEHGINSNIESAVNTSENKTQQSSFPITCSPFKTRRVIAIYATGFTLFLLSGVLWNTPGRLRFLFLALTANGIAMSLFGMVQRFRWENAIYGIYKLEYGGSPFGAFVNRNNAACYLLICFAAGLGLLTSYITHRNEHGYHGQSARSREFKLLSGFSLVLIAGGIVASLSRSGILSLVVPVLVVIGLTMRSGKSIVATLGFLGLLVVMASWFGWGGDLLNRFLVLQDTNLEQIGRIQHLKNTLPSLWDFGIFGSGLGTYSIANRPYQPNEHIGWYVNADNQYLEWALELGAVGCVLVLIVLVGLFFVTSKLLKSSRQLDGFRYSLGVVATFLILSQLVHAVFDFGITNPAVLYTFCAVLGAVCAYHAKESESSLQPVSDIKKNRLQMNWNSLLAFGCFIIMASALAVTGSAYEDEKFTRQISKSIQDVPNTTAMQLQNQRKLLLARIANDSESVLLAESLVQVDQTLMRLEFLKQQSATSAEDITRYWNNSYPLRLALIANGQSPLTETIHRVWKQEELAARSRNYENSLRHAITLEPTNGQHWRELGILSQFRNQPQKVILHQLQNATKLKPAELDIQILYAIELAAGYEEKKATDLFRDLMIRFPEEAMRIWMAARRSYSIEKSVQYVLPADIANWESIWNWLASQEDKKEALVQFATAVSQRLKTDKEQGESAIGLYLRSLSHELQGDLPEALRLMKQAVIQKPLAANWRMEYARLLVLSGQVNAARKELEKALRIDPDNRQIEAAYRKVLALRSDKKEE